MALAFSLKNDLTIALILAIVHLGLSAGFATGMLGPGSAIQKIPVVNVITDPSNYLTISLIACAAMVIILGLAVADVSQHKIPTDLNEQGKKSTSCQNPPCYCIDTDFFEQKTGTQCTTDMDCTKDPEFVGYCDTDKTYKPECHPGSATVLTKGGKNKNMTQLKIGDLVFNGKDFEPIIGFSRNEPDTISTFYEFVTENDHKLQITATHLLYANGELKLPMHVEVGDVFETQNGPSKVSSIDLRQMKGLYHPKTASTKLYVNGVKTSVLLDDYVGIPDFNKNLVSMQALVYNECPKVLVNEIGTVIGPLAGKMFQTVVV